MILIIDLTHGPDLSVYDITLRFRTIQEKVFDVYIRGLHQALICGESIGSFILKIIRSDHTQHGFIFKALVIVELELY